jgi:hypothetical protein
VQYCGDLIEASNAMQIQANLALKRIPNASGDESPQSEIWRDGQPMHQQVPGAILEACVQWHDKTLLLVTDDVPYEEALRIILLDKDMKMLDVAELGAPYSTGAFKDLMLLPPDALSFRFIGDTTWTVTLLAQPGFRRPFFTEPRGVSRPFGFQRQFVLDGQPVGAGG